MSSFALEHPATRRAGRFTGPAMLAGYALLYALMLLAMVRYGKFDPGEAIGAFVVLGIGFSLLAWLLTLGVKPLPYEVREPARELKYLLLYLLPLAALVAYGFQAVHHWVIAEPAASIAILAVKLAIFVILPGWLIASRFGYKVPQLAPFALPISHLLVFLGMSIAILVFQSIAGRGLRDIAAANVAPDKLLLGMPFVFVWLMLEVGVVEEFFFRVLLQSRLSAVLRSEIGGIVLMALLFGLVHAPGLYLRTNITQEGLSSHPSLWMAIGYSIVITSVAGFFLGVLWARTRNFLLLAMVHAAADLLPNTLPTLQAFHIVK